MGPPSPAPFYALMYQSLCEIARPHGYTIAVHGSMTNDLDLIACPWEEGAIPAEEIMQLLMNHINASNYEQALVRYGIHPDEARYRGRGIFDKSKKPHGRVAWNLYLSKDYRIDLSVMPLLPK